QDNARAQKLSQVYATLKRLYADVSDLMRFAGGTLERRKLLRESAALLAEMELGYCREQSDACGQLLKRAAHWYREACASRWIVSGYRWDWALRMPHIDPLVGFRIR